MRRELETLKTLTLIHITSFSLHMTKSEPRADRPSVWIQMQSAVRSNSTWISLMDVRQGVPINSTPSISADDCGMSVSSSG